MIPAGRIFDLSRSLVLLLYLSSTTATKNEKRKSLDMEDVYWFRNMQELSMSMTLAPSTSSSPSLSPSISAEPSNTPTPTASPTVSRAPSVSMAPTTSQSPSISPSSVPSTVPSFAPSLVPSSVPSFVPSMVPSNNPSSSPSFVPSEMPSSVPSMVPSSIPSSEPSVSLSPTKSLAPSISLVPTISGAPSTVPTEQCGLGLTLTCSAPEDVSPDGSCTFDYTEPPGCEQTPTEMTLRYMGGDCSNSFNLQTDTFFACEDYGENNQGPPTEAGVFSYITAFAFNGGDTYFSDFVSVGSDFVFAGAYAANMNITIYDPNDLTDPNAIMQPENILQTFVFQTLCADNLFLNDKFGSIELVEFKNNLQGTVSVFQTLTLSFEVTSEIEDVELVSMDIFMSSEEEGNLGVVDLTDDVSGNVVSPGKKNTFTGMKTVTIDLTKHRTYTAEATIVGEAVEGHKCYGEDSTSFTAGAPLTTPTAAPSASPSISMPPSSDPENTECNLTAGISCMTLDGESCDSLGSPVSNTCIGDNAEELSFLYLSWSTCDGSNSQDLFECTDFNTAINRPFEVFVNVYRGGDSFYADTVFSGQVFKVTIPELNNEIQIKISTVIDGNAGVTLQESTMSVQCRETDGLTLLDTFGHLQLTGYRNADLGSQQVFTDIELAYTVRNDGQFDANLVMATIDSPLSGVDEVVSTSDPKRLIGPNDVETFVTTTTLNLAAAAGNFFDFFFEIEGEGALSGKVCSDMATFGMQIN